MTDTVDKIVIQAETQGVQQSTADVQGLTKAMDGVTVASANVEKSTGSVDSKFASLERRFGTTAGQAAQLAKVQQTVNAAVAANPALQNQANEVLAAATARYGQAAVEVEKLGTAHGGLNAQGQSALHSIRSFGEQLALGIPPTQALTGQLNHLTFAASGEGGLAGAFSQVTGLIGQGATKLAGFVTPAIAAAGAMGALSVGAIASAVHWSSAQGDIEKALVGIGRQSGITATDINAIGVATSATTKLSIGQATELATAFAATGRVSKEVLGPATQATEGLAKALGVDSADAAKLFAAALADPAKGVAELDAKVGAFNSTTREQIAQAIRMGDVGTAQALMIRGVVVATQDATKANESWADSFSDVWKSIKNGANLVGKDVVQGAQNFAHDIGGAPPSAGVPKQQQLAVAQTDLSSFQQSMPAALAANAGDPQAIQAVYDQYAKLIGQVQKLKESLAGQDIAAWNAQLDKMANAAGNDAQALIPQISQIQKLQGAISDLTRAQNVTSVGGPFSADYSAALTAAQNQLQLTRESKDEAARYNDAVKDIGQAWEGVSLKTALQLQQLLNQLPVAQAVTGEARMQAQYYATINGLLDQGKSLMDAEAIAGAQLAISQAQSNASVEKQIQSLKDSTALIKAQQNGTEATTAAAIAYKNAIASGADETTAASLAAATLSNYMAKGAAATLQWQQNMLGVSDAARQAAESSQQAAQAMEDAARAASDAAGGNFGSQSTGGFGGFDTQKGTQYTSTYGFGGIVGTGMLPGASQPTNTQNMAPDAALASAKSTTVTGSAGVWINGIGWVGGTPGGSKTTPPDYNQVASLYDLKNAQTTDKSVQLANLKEELAWLQTQPETVARDQSIVSLIKSIDQLKAATNANTAATLNPLYTQGAGALSIGYYHAANGLDGVVQGSGGVDSVPVHIMMTPGEPIKAGPAANNNNAAPTRTTTVVQNFDFRGVSTNNQRRNVRQYAQGFGQTAAAMN